MLLSLKCLEKLNEAKNLTNLVCKCKLTPQKNWFDKSFKLKKINFTGIDIAIKNKDLQT